MTATTATLDAVDRAFLWHAERARRHPSQPSQALSDAAPVPVSILPQPVTDDGMGTLVDRLLRVVPHAWTHLARRVEDARRDGAEVIAITGARRGEGRTTLVECLARTLAARGRHVERHDRVPPQMTSAVSHHGSIVLVDAGIWFPGGPIRRAWLQRQSLGCHAVILARRADEPACAARGAALEAVGLKVLGEVVTMVPPATSGIQVA